MSTIPYPRLDPDSAVSISPNSGRLAGVCIGFGGIRGDRFVIDCEACAFPVN